jgi:ABC-type uncharacterized transport system auxiliary subunit
MRQSILTILTAGLLAGLAACGAARPLKYYSLEPQEASATPGTNAYPVTLLVGRIQAPHLFRDDRIVYRTGDVQLGTYEYDRWSEPPVEMLEGILLQTLRNSGKYRGVERLGSTARGDLIVRGHLLALEEVDNPGIAARLTMDLELYDPKAGSTLWTQSYSHDEPVSSKEVPAVIEAMDHNVKAGMAALTSGMAGYFASHPRQ